MPTIVNHDKTKGEIVTKELIVGRLHEMGLGHGSVIEVHSST